MLGSACHLLDSVRGVGIPPWVGIPGEAHLAPRICPLQTPIGRARLNPPESVRHGRPFGEQGSILCGQSRVQGRNPPVFSARNPGKSLTTQSSIRHRGRRRKGGAVTAPKCCLFSNLCSGSGFSHLLDSVRWAGIPPGMGFRVKRTVRFRGKGVPWLRAKETSLRLGSDSLVGGSGERSLDPHGAGPGGQGSRPPRFLGSGNAGKARQRIQYPAPANARARVLEPSCPK